MRRCDCEQCKLWIAIQNGDQSLVEHAFSLLGLDGGHYEGYGDSYAGAGACYVLRVGSKRDRSRLAALVRQNESVRRRIVGGLWQEYDLGYKLIAKIFELSSYEERFEIMVAIDIEDSEKRDVRNLLKLLLRLELLPWEDVLLHQTKERRNWA